MTFVYLASRSRGAGVMRGRGVGVMHIIRCSDCKWSQSTLEGGGGGGGEEK